MLCVLLVVSLLISGAPYSRVHAGLVRSTGGTLWVLSLGINTYNRGSHINDIAYGVADAQAVAEAFSKTGETAKVSTLLGAQATLSGVKKALKDLADELAPEDRFVFYFAGMGWPAGNCSATSAGTAPIPCSGEDYQFLLADTSAEKWGGDVHSALSARDLSDSLLAIPARRQIIILDSYHSGLAFEAVRRALNADSTFTLRTRGRRFALLGVAGQSHEDSFLAHGAMTYALLEGLKGSADLNHDGVITEAELEGYILGQLPNLAPDEQLLSYSDLRGLCVSINPAQFRANHNPEEPIAPDRLPCNYEYGYDFSAADVVGKRRGFGPEEPDQPQEADSRGIDFALIFGGDTYEHWDKLANPIYDTEMLQKELIQNYGYLPRNIVFVKDPTRHDIRDRLADLQKRSFSKNDRLLIYFAGHGDMTTDGAGYVVTRESASPTDDPYRDTYTNYSILRDMIDALPIDHIMVVLDVCYGGSFKQRKRPTALQNSAVDNPVSLDEIIRRKMEHRSRFFIASGGLRKVFDGQPRKHSPFARAFLKTLRLYGGDVHLIDAGQLVGSIYTLSPQPFYGGFGTHEENGDFLFIPNLSPKKVADPGLD